MPPRPADRALRRILAELAATTTEDVEAVLDILEDDQRRRVAELLAAYIGGEAPPEPPVRPRPPAAPRLPGLSPWLALRMRLALKLDDKPPATRSVWLGPPARGQVVAMTPTAMKALAACAAGLAPPAATTPSLRNLVAGLLRRAGVEL